MSASPRTGRARILEASTSANEGAFTLGDWGLFVAISLIWGSSFLFIAVGLESIEPGLITWGRVALGAAVLNVVPRARVRIQPEDRPRLLVLSVVWVAVPFTLFPLAEQHINSAVTGMLNGAQPIFAAAVAGVLLRRPPGARQAGGLLVGLAGVVLISVSQAGEGGSAWLGVVMVLAATLCYGFAVNIAPPIQQRYGPLAVMARMLLWASVWTAPFGLWSIDGSSWDLEPVLAVAFIGAVGTGIAFVIMGMLVGRVGATRASLITYLIPVVALGLGVALQDDEVTTAAVAGIGLVIAGALLASRAQAPVATSAGRWAGRARAMTEERPVDEDRVAGRAELLPEEEAVGSDDPEGQAREILADSDERTADRDAAPSTHLEHRSSDEATEPVD